LQINSLGEPEISHPSAPDPAPEAREQPKIPIQCLIAADSPRLAGEDAEHIKVLAEAEAPLPPILVHRATMRVIDGMHRLQAAILKGEEAIEVCFFDGTEDEAFIAAVKSNISHGLPLTLSDRQAAAERIVRSNPQRSDRWIASITGLAAGTVGSIRRKMPQNGKRSTVRIGKDGRMRPLSSAEGRQIASEEIARRPDASLREIARVAGISPATVRDVRERLRRGDIPAPRGQEERPARRTDPADPAVPDSRRAGSPPALARGRGTLLQDLHKDPSLRHTESGRALLRWLDSQARGPGNWEEILNGVSPHAFYTVVKLARCCAEEWLHVAVQLENRLQSMEG
jgi:ParB-like nuclease domain